MSDLFTSRNPYDEQLDGFTSAAAIDGLAEAGLRRLVVLKGHRHAAARFYRLADIAAGAHVVPVETILNEPTAAERELEEQVAKARRDAKRWEVEAKEQRHLKRIAMVCWVLCMLAAFLMPILSEALK